MSVLQNSGKLLALKHCGAFRRAWSCWRHVVTLLVVEKLSGVLLVRANLRNKWVFRLSDKDIATNSCAGFYWDF